MGKLGRQSENPSWFDLEKYSFTDNLECWKWARLLNHRHRIKSLLESRDRKSNTEGNIWDMEIENEFRLLVDNLEICSSGEGFEVEAPQPDGAVHFPTRRVSAVEALTVGGAGFLWGAVRESEFVAPFELNFLEDRDPPTFYEARDFWSLSKKSVNDLFLQVGEMEEPWYEGCSVYLSIDIAASEARLMEEFQAFIRDEKRKLNLSSMSSRKFGRAERKRWHQNRVLPYLDLILWFGFKRVPITQQEIGVLLFPDELNVALSERIRKTLKPLADEVMSDQFLYALSHHETNRAELAE
jgi:hypothetical protein